jgi:hypothetical protein
MIGFPLFFCSSCLPIDGGHERVIFIVYDSASVFVAFFVSVFFVAVSFVDGRPYVMVSNLNFLH